MPSKTNTTLNTTSNLSPAQRAVITRRKNQVFAKRSSAAKLAWETRRAINAVEEAMNNSN